MPRLSYWWAVVFLAAGVSSRAQNLVANPSFEAGAGTPSDWVLSNPLYCSWNSFGLTGGRSVSVTNFNANCNGMQWRSAAFAVQPGKPYLVNFSAVSSNGAEVARIQVGLGTPGNSALNDRFVFPPADWRSFPFATLAPRNQSSLILRLISCQGAGTVSLDDVEVSPIEPAHSLDSGGALGIGESVSPGKYLFSPNYRDLGLGYYTGNYARPAFDCTGFYSTFFTYSVGAGTQVAFRHDFAGKTITNAVMRVTGIPQ